MAIKQDVRRGNIDDIPQMVTDLLDEDPAIRFYAIEALRRLTDDDFGYHYYEDESQRAIPTARWQSWLKAQNLQQR